MTREDLRRLKELTRLRTTLEARMQSLYASATKTTALLDGLPHAATWRSALEEAVVKIEESEREIESTLAEYYRLRQRLLDELNVSDAALLEREIIRQRYADGRSFKAISTTLNISISRVFQLHRKGLKNFCGVA